jgi:uncharacterized protein with PIN domain
MICNGTLRSVDVSSIRDKIPVRIARDFDHFRICNRCERVYWRGSHYDKLAGLLEAVLELTALPAPKVNA